MINFVPTPFYTSHFLSNFNTQREKNYFSYGLTGYAYNRPLTAISTKGLQHKTENRDSQPISAEQSSQLASTNNKNTTDKEAELVDASQSNVDNNNNEGNYQNGELTRADELHAQSDARRMRGRGNITKLRAKTSLWTTIACINEVNEEKSKCAMCGV